jgi:hypothetical protein
VCPLSNTQTSTVPTPKTTIDTPKASTKRASSRRCLFFGPEKPRQFFAYHRYLPCSCAVALIMLMLAGPPLRSHGDGVASTA